MRLKLGNNNCHLIGSVDERARVRGYAGTRAARSNRSSHCPSPSSGPFFAATVGDLHAALDCPGSRAGQLTHQPHLHCRESRWSLLSASTDITRFGNSLSRRLRNTALGGRGVHGLERVAARNASEPCFRAARCTRAEVAGPDGCVWANDRGKMSAGGSVSLWAVEVLRKRRMLDDAWSCPAADAVRLRRCSRLLSCNLWGKLAPRFEAEPLPTVM
jgi:hypothetical protein